MSFKPMGPGHPTGGETTDGGAPGNKDYYPNRESEGYVTGGEGGAAATKESSVPARPNPQSGAVATESEMRSSIAESAAYGGHDGSFNPTGSSVSSPAGSRTSDEAGFYGSRPAGSPGTNAEGESSSGPRADRGYSTPTDRNA
jgi:hypothetical protein